MPHANHGTRATVNDNCVSKAQIVAQVKATDQCPAIQTLVDQMRWTLVPKKVTQVWQLLPEKVNYRSWESTWTSSNKRKIWPAPEFEDVCHELGGVMDFDIRILFFRAWKWLCQWCTGMNFAQCIKDASCEGLHSSHATEFNCEIAKLPPDFSGGSTTCHKRVVPGAPVCGGVKSAMKQPAKSQDPSSMNGLIRSKDTPFNTFRSQTNEDPTVVVQQWTAKKPDTFGRFLLNTHQCQVCAEVLSVGQFESKINQYLNAIPSL